MLDLNHPARELAVEAHRGQKYGDQPYVVHLDHVVEVLRRFGVKKPDTLAAGYLHDTLEDTLVTKGIIRKRFGPRVADIVDACTDGTGVNRKARKERPYRLVPQVPGALEVKLADRIANVESSLKSQNKGLFRMYRKEHREFFDKLYHPDQREMFEHLNELLNANNPG